MRTYIVFYTTDEFCRVNRFVTLNLELADSWVSKYNRIYDKWNKYYLDNRHDIIEGSLLDQIFNQVKVGRAYIQDIQVR
jgi:hypothetical protein